MSENTLRSKREYSIDVLKCIAIVGVLIIHISADGVLGQAIGSANWISSVFWGSVIRFSVPVFFMCSGALLLDPEKNITITKLFSKYIFRILVALFFWAFAYEVVGIILNGTFSAEALIGAVKNVIKFQHHFHLYYLHMILLNYAFLPLSRVFIKHATRQEFKYALMLWFAVGIILPTVKHFYPFNMFPAITSKYLMNATYASIGYSMMGYYIKKYAPAKTYIYAVLFAGGFAFTFGGTVLLSLHRGVVATEFLEGMSIGVALMSMGIFGFVFKLCKNATPKKAFTSLSAASFCIYLVHDFFNILLRRLHITIFKFAALGSIPGIACIVLALSLCVYFVIRKIPVVKKYLI